MEEQQIYNRPIAQTPSEPVFNESASQAASSQWATEIDEKPQTSPQSSPLLEEKETEEDKAAKQIKKMYDAFKGLNKTIPESTFSNDFFRRYGQRIFVFILLATFYINLRHECEKSIYNIDKLKQELDDARYTSIAKWGELTKMNKPETVRQRVAESSVSLIPGNEPPILLKK